MFSGVFEVQSCFNQFYVSVMFVHLPLQVKNPVLSGIFLSLFAVVLKMWFQFLNSPIRSFMPFAEEFTELTEEESERVSQDGSVQVVMQSYCLCY